MQLTPHFTLSELTRSTTAQRMGVDNTPTPKALEQLKRTAQMLEGVRSVLSVPVIVTSGYRSPAVNRAVGGATSSDHLQGQAADIVAPKYGRPYDVAKALVPHINALGIGQIIYEKSGSSEWVHVSARVPDKPVNRVITIVVGKGAQLGIQDV